MPVEIHEFEVSPAPAPPAAPGGGAPAPAAAPAHEPDLEHLARARRMATAVRELQLRVFSH
ncbi:hypothetical protein LXT12_05665 [Pelomonas sp. P7]|uniref:Uncharacterized protein n=1 Tax=Pelomonas caseinilytica TaxID=2906763 RepID=A0ABS8XBJ7_9BURK|nr:hypothetical protein [Pelomonas sp. P7]MCE4536737.1 hypothetical protein [Pelomonas sp. P7]